VSEATPIADVPPILHSALAAEQQTQRFAQAGGRGLVLRFGLLDGPGTGHDQPIRDFGATLHVQDAARALLAALTLPSGTYYICRDGERVSNPGRRRAVRVVRADRFGHRSSASEPLALSRWVSTGSHRRAAGARVAARM
jgi:nucleoside-diphosphate-sugar epimerase